MSFRAAPPPAPLGAAVRPVAAAAAVAVLALFAYANSFRGAFVFDDVGSIVENESIRRVWPLRNVLQPPANAGVGGRPVANLTLALNYAWSGLDPRSYHVVNAALHAATALLLFGLVRRTLDRLPAPARADENDNPRRNRATMAALATASLWAVHPVLTATVAYMSQRTEQLMALCYLATLYAFIRAVDAAGRWPRRGWSLAAVAACALGMGAKETMATAPIIVLLHDRTFLAGSFRAAWRARGTLHAALASTWAVLAGLLVASPVRERGVGFQLGVSTLDYALNASRAITHYLQVALWPHPLIFDYGWDYASRSAALPHAAICALLVTATTVAVVRRHPLGFLGCWFLLILAPTSSIVPVIQQPIADSRLYLPLAAVIAAAVALMMELPVRSRRALAVAVAAGWLVLTLDRNGAYRSEISLWADTVAKKPDDARAYGNLAAALLRRDRIADAIRAAERAVALRPDYAEAHQNLALGLARSSRLADAIREYRAALRANPNLIEAHYNLGDALVRTGAPADAIAEFEAALRLDPAHAAAHNNLSVALLQTGRVADAIVSAERALAARPAFAEAHYNLGNALAAAGKSDAAATEFERALEIDVGFAKAHNNLGVLRLRGGDRAGAIAHFEAALGLNPTYAEARRNLEIARRDGSAP